MSWNYRVMRTRHPARDGVNEVTFGIHEVYSDGITPREFTVEPMAPHGETVEELRADLKRMQGAIAKPVLEYTDGKFIEDGDDDGE